MRAAHDPNPPDPPEIARFAELPVVPWRNGGGVTREVATGGSGEEGFDWRISIADVEVPGPFSAFPGLDRTITLVGGERMDLVIDGVEPRPGPASAADLRRCQPDVVRPTQRSDARPQRHDA